MCEKHGIPGFTQAPLDSKDIIKFNNTLEELRKKLKSEYEQLQVIISSQTLFSPLLLLNTQ